MSLAVEIARAELQADRIRKAKVAMENEKYLARKLAEREVEIQKLKRENESLKRKVHALKVELGVIPTQKRHPKRKDVWSI